MFKSAEFFFPSATLHTQKKVKEIAYILTCYQALLKAQLFFFIICTIMEDNKMKIQLLFLSFFIIIWYNSLLISESVYSSW